MLTHCIFIKSGSHRTAAKGKNYTKSAMWLKMLSSEPIMFLHAVAYMINISILPQLVLHKMCVRENGNGCKTGSEIIDPQISEDSASWWFIIVISSQVPAVFTVLIWGPISDVIGRKNAAIVIPIVNMAQNIVFILCSYYIESHPAYLCIGMFLSCLFGEFPGVIALSCSFIADVTANKSPKTRMTRMAVIDCVINIAGLPAGLFAGQLLQRVGFLAVFGFSIGLNTLLLFYIVVILPSNIKHLVPTAAEDSENVELNFDLLNPLKQIQSVYRVITDKERRNLILPAIGIFMFCIYAFVGELTITALYLKGTPINLRADLVGYYYANQAIIRSIGVIAVTQVAKRFKVSEMNVILFGLTSHVFCYLLIGFSNTTLFVFLANIAGFAVPAPMSVLRSYTSTKASPKHAGTIMAAFESFDALSYILNLMSLEVYRATLNQFSGTVFVLLSGCSFIAFCLTLLNKCYLQKMNANNQAASNIEAAKSTPEVYVITNNNAFEHNTEKPDPKELTEE